MLTSTFVCDIKLTFSKQHAFMDCSVIGHSLMKMFQFAVQHNRFRPVQKFRDRNSNFLTFPGLYFSHPLKTVYYISFTALLMPPYFTEPTCTIAFSLLSQFSYIFNAYTWKDVMLLQNKTVLRLRANLITPFLPYRTENKVSDMLKYKDSRCKAEADMFDITIIRDIIGSHLELKTKHGEW